MSDVPVKPVLVVHGGCGLIPKKSFTPEYEAKCRADLTSALMAGYKTLKKTNSSLDAVVEAVKILEDSPCFNAGKGAAYTTALTNECDAGLMDGTTGKSGGVSTVTRVKNPILLARKVMEQTRHTVLCSRGAETFAEKCGMEMVDPKYFHTDRRYEQVLKVLKDTNQPVPQLDHNVPVGTAMSDEKVKDTVGAVAVDTYGRLAGASSTGGLTAKMPGRVSDSSIPGAGYYADHNVAVSGTGDGDYFLRRSTCLQVGHLMKYEKLSLSDACNKVIHQMMGDCSAGVIAVDKRGNFAMPYNSEGMFRGVITDENNVKVFIWDY